MPKRPMKLEDLFALRAVGRVALAPDGRHVAFELKRFDLADNRNYTQIMLVDAQTGVQRPLTDGKRNDSLPKWSPDGSRIAFLSDRDKGTTLWVLPMDGGEPQRITAPEGFVKDFDWSPSGRRIAYAYQEMSRREKLERDEKHDDLKRQPAYKYIRRLHHKFDGAGWWNGNYTHIFVIDATGGRARQLTRGDYDDAEPRFSPDGKLVSFVSNRVPDPDLDYENSDIYVVPAAGGGMRKLKQIHGAAHAASWSPDGKTLAYIGDAARRGEGWKHFPKVWTLPARGGPSTEVTRDIDNPNVNITISDTAVVSFGAEPPLWSAAGDRVFFLVSEQGATRLYSRAVGKRDRRCEVGGNLSVNYYHRSVPHGPIALTIASATNPADVYLFNPEAPDAAARLRRLTDVNAAVLARIHVGEPEEFWVQSGDAKIHAWVLKPPGFDPRRKYPAILEIHGGPHTQYGYSFFHEMQWLAARGYVVVFSNPRGSIGYGLKHSNCIHADWGNIDYKDVMKVADWMFSRPYIDRKRIGVTGGSYGGYMTNWIVGHTDRFAAAVTQRSVVNVESMFGTSDFGYDLGNEFGGSPWKNWERLRRQSPLTHVANIRTPLLIEHEEQDHRCPIEQGEQLFSCLKALGRKVEMIRFEGESHGLSRGGRPQNRAERLRRIVGWFDEHMK